MGAVPGYHLAIHSNDPLTYVLLVFPFYSEGQIYEVAEPGLKARLPRELSGERRLSCSCAFLSVFLLLSSSVRASAPQTLGVHLTITLHSGRAPLCLLLSCLFPPHL